MSQKVLLGLVIWLFLAGHTVAWYGDSQESEENAEAQRDSPKLTTACKSCPTKINNVGTAIRSGLINFQLAAVPICALEAETEADCTRIVNSIHEFASNLSHTLFPSIDKGSTSFQCETLLKYCPEKNEAGQVVSFACSNCEKGAAIIFESTTTIMAFLNSKVGGIFCEHLSGNAKTTCINEYNSAFHLATNIASAFKDTTTTKHTCSSHLKCDP